MAWIKVETVDLFTDLRTALTELLRSLDPEEWVAPTVCGDWAVGDVAAHLLSVELSKVARGRDGAAPGGPPAGGSLADWLAEHNERWVVASREFLSPRLLADLLDVTGPWYEEWVASLDLELLGEPVSWAGRRAAPVWMDVAREYTERWVHQQHIREALDLPGMDDERYLGAVIATFVHALPVALSREPAPEGTAVGVHVDGGGGGDWHVIRWHSEWDLWPGSHAGAAAQVTTTAENAWRLFTRHPKAEPAVVTGDQVLGAALGDAVAIIA
jgi:uncharacterized protein (TIGR03083 family)